MSKSDRQYESISYTSLVSVQSRQRPCLQNLLTFLGHDRLGQYACRIICLEFPSSTDPPTRQSLDFVDLQSLLCSTKHENPRICGRILFVEDLSRDIIELLGLLLDIDPLFFASHIDVFKDEVGTTRPSTASLPSTMLSQNFLNLQYHRIIALEYDNFESERGIFRDMNIPRKVALLPKLKGRNIGLARHCCSILKTQSKDGLWLG